MCENPGQSTGDAMVMTGGQECPSKGPNSGGFASLPSKYLIRVPRLGLHLSYLPQSNLIE